MQPTQTRAETAPVVNVSLTPPRRVRRVVENDKFGAFVRRVVRAHSRRIADGDVEALPDLLTLARDIDTAIGQAVTGLRQYGYSWAEIASRLGITRQAAQQRWGGEKQ